MRIVIAILIGLALAIGVEAGFEYFSSQLFPYPRYDVLDRARGGEILGARPAIANFIGLGGYLLGALGGGYAARLLGRRDGLAWVPGGVLAVQAAVLALYYSLTGWGQAGAVAAALLGAVAAHRLPLAARREDDG